MNLIHFAPFVIAIAVNCGELEYPEDGKVVTASTIFKSVAVYICNDGYVIVNGSTNRTCQADGHWTGTKPSCTGGCTIHQTCSMALYYDSVVLCQSHT